MLLNLYRKVYERVYMKNFKIIIISSILGVILNKPNYIQHNKLTRNINVFSNQQIYDNPSIYDTNKIKLFEDFYIKRVDNGLIGCHEYGELLNYDHIGKRIIFKEPGPYTNGTSFKQSSYTFTATLGSEISFSVTEKKGLDFQVATNSKLDIATSTKSQLDYIYTIEDTLLETYSTMLSFSKTVVINQDLVVGRNFKLGIVAETIWITGQTFLADDYWWNHKQIRQDSYKRFDGYITYNPVLTIVYDDGTYVI